MSARPEAASPWPAISVVIPSLNQGRYLGDAIESLLSQHYPRLELIVADGGSTDETLDVIARFAPQLAHWVSEPDRGPAAAINAAFARATGEIFGVLNADDWLLPGSLGTVARAFLSQSTVDVWSGHGFFASADRALGPRVFSDAWNPIRFRYGACVLLQPATFVRRSAFERVGGFRDSGRVCWDMELWADLAKAGAAFGTIDAALAVFRLHDASITGRSDMRLRRRVDARQVAAELNGGDDSVGDRLRHYGYRAVKFARHPIRTLHQRCYFRSTLGRWSL